MEVDWRLDRLPTLDEDTYVDLVCDALEIIPPEMVIMRLVAEGSQDEILAPSWSFEKERIMNKMGDELERRKSCQGKFFKAPAFNRI